jgi:hypothetical protein
MDNGFHIRGGLDLIQLPLQFFIVDTVEILSPECLLDIFLPPPSRIIDLSNEHLVSLALLRPFCSVQEFVSTSYLGVEGRPLVLPLNDLRVTRESSFDILRNVL